MHICVLASPYILFLSSITAFTEGGYEYIFLPTKGVKMCTRPAWQAGPSLKQSLLNVSIATSSGRLACTGILSVITAAIFCYICP